MFRTFVPVDQIAQTALSFQWDDWDPYAAVGNPASERVDILGFYADRALVGYATACAEWVTYRFSKLSDDETPYRFLEALWVYGVDPRYMPPPESNEDEWKGPVRGPIDLALMTVLNTIASTDDGKPEVDAALAEQIAWHVVDDKSLFVTWRDRCLQRLTPYYPRSLQREKTGGIAPQWFDLQVDPAQNPSFATEFLRSVVWNENAFLRHQHPLR